MYSSSVTARVFAVLLITSLFALSAASAWAVTDDLLRRQTMPTGASVDGAPVGGLSRQAAAGVVEAKVRGPLLQQATATFEGKQLAIEPSDFVVVDVEGMLDEALAPKTSAPLYARVLARVTSAPVGRDVKRATKVDTAKLTAWLAGITPQLTVPAEDASRSVTTGVLRVIPEKQGATIDATSAAADVAAALESGSKRIQIPVTVLEPRVRVASLGKTIFVKLRQRRLYLYDGATLEKEYGVAIGQPGFPTPKGWYTIINKRRNPGWSNPGSDWAKSMPQSIPPGPSNPLGTRALDLDTPGIRIHGTNKDGSIGTAASHGCMRMHRWDIEDLFERVPVGTRVIILG